MITPVLFESPVLFDDITELTMLDELSCELQQADVYGQHTLFGGQLYDY
jgi:hypothetical protein